MTLQPHAPSALVQALEREAEAHPLARKVLVAGTFGEGRELLHAVALRRGGWAAFEVTTPGRLATELAGPDLAARGLDLLDDFGRQALVDRAADRVLEEGSWSRLSELAEGVGFRQAVRQTVDALRLSDIGPQELERAQLRDEEKKHFLRRLLEVYEALLREGGRTDHAGLFRAALDRLRESPPPVEDARILLVPGLSLRGLTGRLIRGLQERGARVLPADPVRGLEPGPGRLWAQETPRSGLSFLHTPGDPEAAEGQPPVEIFSASSVSEEIREALRIVLDTGLAWDEVEIVARDAAAYGSALHALSARLDVPVSYAVGLPLERTRVGRATAAYLEWIEDGFPADTLRALLHAGDLAPRGDRGRVSAAALARRLRSLRIGWRRERYAGAIEDALASLDKPVEPRDGEPPEEARRRWDRKRRELEVLRATVVPVLKATPPVPSGPGAEEVRVSPAELARGLRTFLERVPRGGGAERIAHERVLEVLGRVRESLTRKTRFPAAMTVLRRHLEIRVPASRQDQPAPWEASGGHLHLSDLEHGGVSGRKATFVVGLTAEGADPTQDPLLLDRDRRTLAPDDLPTSGDRARDRRFRLAALLARVRGRVFLSYPSWDPAQARVLSPDSVVLRAFRLREGRPDATFQDLRESVGTPACPVPRGGSPLDSRDVWLKTLSSGGRLLRGRGLVRAVFRGLDAGLEARAARRGPSATAHDGLVRPRPHRHDPRRAEGLVTSARRLEELGTCPKRYLYSRVLGLRPPEEVDREPDRWLDPRVRGILLHRVFEATLRRAREEGVQAGEPGFTALALEILGEEVERAEGVVPAPGRRVVRRETEELRADTRAFCQLLAEGPAPWVALELQFGLGGQDPVDLALPGGEIEIRGAVDRVDRRPGGLRVVDYKTGGTSRFAPDTGAFHGGRRLQHVVYAAAVERLMGEPVAEVEYHFPTGRGMNEIRRYGREDLEGGLELVDTLLDVAAAGRFLPTDDEADCRFCDFRDACRVRVSDWAVDSPPASWAAEHGPTTEEFRDLRRVRQWEEEP